MNCTKCGKKLRSSNTKGVCADAVRCRKRVAGEAVDDQVLDRVGIKTPPTTPETEPAPPDWQRQFFQLAEALGLNPVQMLEEHCQHWVEQTRARALAKESKGEGF